MCVLTSVLSWSNHGSVDWGNGYSSLEAIGFVCDKETQLLVSTLYRTSFAFYCIWLRIIQRLQHIKLALILYLLRLSIKFLNVSNRSWFKVLAWIIGEFRSSRPYCGARSELPLVRSHHIYISVKSLSQGGGTPSSRSGTRS